MEVTLRLKHWRMKLASEYCDYLEMKPEEKMRSLSDYEKVVLYSRLMLHHLNTHKSMWED